MLTLTILALAIPTLGARLFNPRTSDSSPVVELSYGTFQGNTTGNLTSFLGMPFAAPPTGKLRFQMPLPPIIFSGTRDATAYGAACINQAYTYPPLTNETSDPPAVQSEDCLFINVIQPAKIPSGAKLPVVFWIFGGGFVFGDTSQNDGGTVVERSIALGEPIIYVSANYRLNAFGFLASKEVKAAGLGNIGLRDQRFALEWVQKYIGVFGGDPTKVTLWGQSAGAVSIGLHMVANDGNPDGLFRGGFMESGSPYALSDISAGQPYYDLLVNSTGCAHANDTLTCLQDVPLQSLVDAINETPTIFDYQSLQLAWGPRIDGSFFTQSPVKSIQEGKYAKVPFVTGDCEDEGTLFSMSQFNVTTNVQFLEYVHSIYFPGATEAEILAVGLAYPQNVTKGSPYGTGDANVLTPQYKRLASFQGDFFFQAPRRFFLKSASKTQDTWAFWYKRGSSTPLLGASHNTDLPEFYADSPTGNDFIGTDAIVNFVNTLNPTQPPNPLSLLTASGVSWTTWGSSASAPPTLAFLDPAPSIAIDTDNYREVPMELLSELALNVPPLAGPLNFTST